MPNISLFSRYIWRKNQPENAIPEPCFLSEFNEQTLIIALCENVLRMEKDKLREQWGIENEISKLVMVLCDETVNSERKTDKKIAEKCLDLWD